MAFETLSDNTRKIRRSLLAASLVGYAISKIDVSISKVTLFGTEFKIGNFQAIPFLLGLIIIYYLITFIFYALSEYEHLYIEGKREYLSTLHSPIPMTLEAARQESERLSNEIEALEDREKTDYIRKEMSEKEKELRKIRSIMEYLESTKKSFFDVFSFKNIRYILEFLIPIAIAVFSCILVLFFTEFKVEPPKAVKPTVTINTEQVVIKNQKGNTEAKQTTEIERQK